MSRMEKTRRAARLWPLAVLVLIGGVAHAEMTGEQRAEAVAHNLIGSPAPRGVLTTIDGQKIDLGRLYGKKAVYLKFWATWCTPCREQMPHFEHVYETEGSDLAAIAIDVGYNDSIEDIRTYREKLGIKMPIVIDDGSLGVALNLRVTPQHVVIGRDGRIQYVGHLADEHLDAALKTARTSPTPANTRVADGAKLEKAAYYKVGDAAPPFSAKTLDGAEFGEPASGGKFPAVLVFMSPWCEPYLAKTQPTASANCRTVREQVDSLSKQHPEVHFLGVASGIWAAPEDLAKYQEGYKVAIPLTLDESGRLYRAFQVRRLPTIIGIDSSGKIERRIEGADARLVTADFLPK